ncbi:MAG TPA: NAD-dependent epimerase/dehydratase family protein [Actinomycetota bacterium]|nr:NAD-dependent epimerase/dehydratase family protein [Actinomycetota bacterium]
MTGAGGGTEAAGGPDAGAAEAAGGPPAAAKVFITGATGFVGRAVLDQLIAAGREVVALARDPASTRRLEAAGATPVPGDVLDEEGLASAIAGCEVVYHVAGLNAFCLRNPAPLYKVNVEGSLAVVRAAARAGARRVVYTSSASTIGEAPGTIGREDSPHRGDFTSDYEHSKAAAEQAVLAAGQKQSIEVVSVNPSSVQGPGRTSGTGRLLIDYLNGRLKFFVDTWLSLIDIADAAAGHLLAETRGRAGERYLLNGACLTSQEALDLLSRVGGVSHRVRTLPPSVAMAGAAAVEAGCRLLHRTPPVCREQARAVAHGHRYDGTRATRELGLSYTPVEETFRRTIAWYRDHGYVGPTA